MTRAFYNEIDPYAAQWLRNLIDAGLIAPGDVDERSIEEIRPYELEKYTQCHFFAGIGVWSLALRQAGWPDNEPVWTGSCPCQPFSVGGKRGGVADERHLWPAFFNLIEQSKPKVVFGEQVASKDGLGWFDIVQTDLEAKGYATAAVDLCAAGFGAPHIRQRLFWVADADGEGLERRKRKQSKNQCKVRDNSLVEWMAHTDSKQYQNCISRSNEGNRPPESRKAIKFTGFRLLNGMGYAKHNGFNGNENTRSLGESQKERRLFEPKRPDPRDSVLHSNYPTNGYWRDADWLYCRDEKWRAVEPGAFPLAHGVTNRVGRLRAYGNAIVAPVAKEFIKAYIEVKNG